MNTDIVKYSNWLNNLSFAGFGQTDFNLFMVLCAEMKDRGTTERTFTFSDLKKKAGIETHSNTRTAEELDKMTDKMQKVVCKIRTDSELIKFVLFPTFRINDEEGTLTVAVNKDFQFVLNSLASQFTTFELQEFVQLDSRYAKTLYRLLKQFKTTGDLTISADDFRARLNIPKSYPTKAISARIIEPTIRALHDSFPDLKCEVLHASKPGRPVRSYRFSFTPDAPERQRDLTDWQKEKKVRKNYNNQFELQRDYDKESLAAQERILLGEGSEEDYQKF